MLFVGVDWAEAHHEVCVLDQAGAVLGRRRVPDGVAGVAQLHALVADHATEPAEVVVGIELDRGLLVGALVAAGYQVVAVNPLQASRYRKRHGTSGAKSDRGDAKVLADLVRTDRHNHRLVSGDSDLVEAIRVLARAHQSAIWSRQRQLNSLRSACGPSTRPRWRPSAPTWPPEMPWRCSSWRQPPSGAASCPEPSSPRPWVAAAATATSTLGQPRSRPRCAPPADHPQPISQAYGQVTQATVALVASCNQQIATLEEALGEGFNKHPDAKTIGSLPGLGMVLGARVLGEFGADPTRFATAKSRKTMAAAHPSPRPRGARWSCWPATPATAAWPMPWSSGPSAPSPDHLAPAATTTSSGPATRPTAKHCASSPTAGSGSSTPAWTAACSMTNTSPGATSNPQPLDKLHTWDV